jgi:hypothetical protein
MFFIQFLIAQRATCVTYLTLEKTKEGYLLPVKLGSNGLTYKVKFTLEGNIWMKASKCQTEDGKACSLL